MEVTGSVRWGYRAAGKLRADVAVSGPGGLSGKPVLRWSGREQNAVAAGDHARSLGHRAPIDRGTPGVRIA